MRRTSKGFTLLELLVVIGIIAILATLLLPAAAKVREHSRLAACESNQKQIFAAIRVFAQENDDTCPGAGGAIPSTGPAAGNTGHVGIGQPISTSDGLPQSQVDVAWVSTLIVRKYISNSSTFRCPARDLYPAVYNSYTPAAAYHYVFNQFFVGDATMCDQTTCLPIYTTTFTSQHPITPVRLGRTRYPTRCVMITEDGRPSVTAGGQVDNDPEFPQGRIGASPVHLKRGPGKNDMFKNTYADYAVCTFVDGHTESILVGTLTTDPNAYTVACDNTGLY